MAFPDVGWEPWLFFGATLLLVAPLLAFRYFPNSDGPAHTASAVVLNAYSRPGGDVYRRYLEFRPWPPPNLAGHLILSLLVRWTSPPLSDRLMAAFLVLGFSWSMRWALLGWSPHSRPIAYLALPLSTGWLLHMGFQNCSLSFVFYFLALGHWLRHRHAPGAGPGVALGALLLLVYFSHVAGFVMILVTLGGVAIGDAVRDFRQGPASLLEWRRALRSRVFPIALAALPSLLFMGHFLFAGSDPQASGRLPFATRSKMLLSLEGPIVSLSGAEKGFAVALAAILAGLSIGTIRRMRETGIRNVDLRFLGLAALATAIYFAAPNALGGGFFLTRRLTLYPVVLAAFWIAQFPTRRGRALSMAIMACALGLLLVRLPAYAAFNRDLSEYVSAGRVLRKGCTFVPLSFLDQREGRGGTAVSTDTWPLDCAAAYLMAEEGRLDLGHYEASSAGFFLRFRPELDPARWIGQAPGWTWSIPATCDFLAYPSRTSGSVDYVLLWGRAAAAPEVLRTRAAESIRLQLERGYRKIYTSGPRGLMEVYERRR